MVWNTMFLLILLTLLQGAVSLGDPTGEHRHQHWHHPHYRSPLEPTVTAHQARQQKTLDYDLATSTTTVTLCEEDQDEWFRKTRATSRAYEGPEGPEPTSVADDPLITPSASVITVTEPSGIVQILPGSSEPETGSVQTTLETDGHVTTQPILTSPISTPTSIIPTPSQTLSIPTAAPTIDMGSPDIFSDPIATDSPPASISRRQDHPQPRLGIENSTSPLQTNKFYSNFFLGSQSQPTYLIPYSVSWAKGKGSSSSWGLAVSHINASQRVFGPTVANTGAAQYYINPVGTHSLVLSATELGSSTVLNIDQLTDFSARVSLRPGAGMPPAVQFPLVQGSAFVSGIYSGAYPLIQTSVYFKTVTRSIKEPKPGITKYKFSMEDGTTWLMYAYHIKGDALDLHVVNNGLAEGKAPFYGVIQVAKDPGGGEALFDEACGVYATGVELSGSVDGTTAAYSFKFLRGGMSNGTLAMYALPHHQSSFNAATQAKVTPIELDTPTKGRAAIVFSDVWTMVEPDIPVDLGFVPWLPKVGSLSKVSDSAKAFIHNIALQELSQNMIMQSDQDSMYFSGKALAKFASIVLAASDILDDKPLAAAGLGQLKLAFSRFAKNEQKYPLLYESAWGGVVSSAAYVTGDAGADFGNSYYNDHHFHYGYFIYTAAVIGHLDPAWINVNKPFVNTLVRDISNPSTRDKVFPVWRCFDWYHGHSWAHGLFESLDGKDQESSSEDSMHAYAIKMWGTVSQDANMAARGSLMLAVQARSFRDYYLYHSSNTVQPPEFIGNKVAGILFENKIDHTTFFGGNIEYIQGIHMLPLLPHTPYIRAQDFVAEEWNAFFDKGRADDVVGGWKGILFGNLATIDPKGAYAFFSSEDFDPSWLDGGASLTWYLTYAAVLGGL